MAGPAKKPPERSEARRPSLTLPGRFRSNVLSSYLRLAAAAVIGLVMVPVLVHGLGKAAYGVWVIVVSFAAYSEVFQFGFAKATPKYVAEYTALGDFARARSAAATSFWLLSIAGALALLLGVVMAAVFPDLFDVSPGISHAAQALVLIVVVNAALSIPTDTFGGVLIGLQRFDLLNWTLIVVVVAQAIGAVIVITAGGGLVPLGIVTVIPNLLAQVWRYLIARRLIPGLNVSPRRVDRRLVRQLAGLSVWFGLIDVANLLLNSAYTIIVGLVLGVEAAAVYAVAAKLPTAAAQLVAPISGVFFPHSSELAARSDKAGLRDSLVTGTRILLGIGLPLALLISILAGPIIRTWVGPGFGDATAIVVILAPSIVMLGLCQIGLQMLQGIGKPRVPALIFISEGILNVGLAILLANLIGLNGVAWADLLAGLAVTVLAFFPYMCRQFELPPWPFARSLVVSHVPPAAAALAVGWLVTRGHPTGILYLVGAAAAILVSYLCVYVLTGLDAHERRLVASRLRSMRSRPSASSA
jgi:O-antigen/teichoic acid export membrane protein